MRQKTNFPGFLLALGILFPFALGANSADDSAIEQTKSARFFAPPDSPEHLKYPPDRAVEVRHLALDITPDFSRRTIRGSAVLRFRPLVKPVEELKLDAVELNIESVASSARIRAWQIADDHLVINFAEPLQPGQDASVTVAYHAEPTAGIYFRTPEMGYKQGDTHLFSQGEAIEARHWYPCFDAPNEKFTTEISCHVPQGMTVISNGRLVSRDADASGLTTFHWSQEEPQANYLVSLVAGYFKELHDTYNTVPLGFFTPPSEFNEATNSFRTTKDTMGFFEQEIGVPYPWPKYDQVCVNDFVAGGMENTSATTLTDYTLFTDATENVRTSDALVAHEMAHQWFGDLVTCKDWSEIWLNEGFATYYEVLYDGHKNGSDAMNFNLYRNARQILSMNNDVNAIVRRDYDNPDDMFNYLAYPKGGWVLHMIRSDLGPELYRKCIKAYLERHRYGSVTTEDLRAVLEEFTGRSFDQFFNQWVYHAHYPELEARYTWDERTRMAQLSIEQVQALSDKVLLFSFPLKVRFKGSFGTIDRTIDVKKKAEDFYFALDSAPQIVRLDPDYSLLAKISFHPASPMLAAQLADKTDAVGRLLAVAELLDKKDKESVDHLRETLSNDPFYGVRIEASKALRSIHTDEALDALLACTQQGDARVRRQVVMDIGGFYRDTAYNQARHILEVEKNPAIVSQALSSMAGYTKPDVGETLKKYLDSQSYRNELAVAAIGAMRLQDDPAFVTPLQSMLSRREPELTSAGLGQGLSTLANLARNDDKKDGVEAFLAGYLDRKKLGVRIAAISALGTLGDPRAIAALEKFSSASKSVPEQKPAETAVADLRAVRKPVDDFKNLRQEVLDLEKQGREIQKQIDTLKKQVEAERAAGKTASASANPRLLSPKAK